LPAGAKRARGGRPSRAASAQLADTILTAATGLFLRDGYAASSMEAVAAAAGVSKRTLYARFPDKAALLQHAVSNLIAAWLPPFDASLEQALSLEDALLQAAREMLRIALAPEALALHRLVVAEAARFPELGLILSAAGAGAGIRRIAALLQTAGVPDPIRTAEQFQHLVLAGPQLRALGLGPPLTEPETETWAKSAVRLLLRGCEPKSNG
jgi:AcrR family transcriptional regulator